MRVGWWSLAALIALAGCGGGSSGGPRPDDTLRFTTFQTAEVVVGQPIFAFNDANQGLGTPTSQTLAYPGMPSSDPFFLPDMSNHRVLGYSQTPFLSNVGANFVLGQPDLGFDFAGLGATALNAPICARVADGRLFVSDTGNHRVLIWDGVPSDNAAPASVAVGQPDLSSGAAATSATRLRDPAGIVVAGTRLLIADRSNHRVLIWNTIPETSGVAADLVLGQPDFKAGLANGGRQPAADTLHDPFDVWSDGTRVVVADRGNNRVLIWLSFPTTNAQPADLVLGQSDFRAAVPGLGADGLYRPCSIASRGTQFFLADAGNHRVLIWNSFPARSQAPADAVLGQADFEHGAPNDPDQDGAPSVASSARTFFSAHDLLTVAIVGNSLFVGDTGNHRMLVFRSQ